MVVKIESFFIILSSVAGVVVFNVYILLLFICFISKFIMEN